MYRAREVPDIQYRSCLPVDAASDHDTIQGRQVDREEIGTRSMIGEIEGILSALNQAGVRYLVVGGVGAALSPCRLTFAGCWHTLRGSDKAPIIRTVL